MAELGDTRQRILSYLAGDRLHPGIILVSNHPEECLQTAREMAFALLSRFPGERSNTSNLNDRIQRDIHPDVSVCLFEEEDTIKIDHVREICHQMEVAPIEADFKVCIINQCHRMNTSSANAFLKTLEEPGPHRMFILITTQPGSILPTILSRCVQFQFRPTKEVSFSEEDQLLFQKVLTRLSDHELPESFLSDFKTKEKCVSLARYVQDKMRTKILADTSLDHLSEMECYSDALTLEGKLLSNANPSLLTESFLRKQFEKDVFY